MLLLSSLFHLTTRCTVMKIRPIGLTLLLFAVAGCAARTGPQATPADLAITDVTVVDVERGVLIPARTILIRGNRIVDVTSTESPARQTIDGSGKFVITGLWDMHVHLFNNAGNPGTDNSALYFPLMLANGVTGVRDLWTDVEDLRMVAAWRDRVAAGTLFAPRIIPTGPIMDGAPREWPNSLELATADDARRAADSLADAGVRIFKVYNNLSRPAYDAIMGVAKRRGLQVEGHLPIGMALVAASDAGQRTIEHLGGAGIGCSSDPARMAEANKAPQPQRPAATQAAAIATFDPAVCAQTATILARNGTWTVPTLVLHRGRLLAFDSATINDPRFRFLDAATLREWAEARPGAVPAQRQRERREVLRYLQKMVATLQAAGAPVLAGSDLGNPNVLPGFSLHDELALFVEGGMSPLEALRTATLNPARYLAATDSMGTVAAGKLADLVLLDADPLTDIRNTTRIHTVIVNGRVFDRAALIR